MRIAFFSDNYFPELSGIADSITTIGYALAKEGHEILYVAPKYSKREYSIAGTSEHRDLPKHIAELRLSSFSIPSPTKQARAVIPVGKAARYLRDWRPDILHTHLFFGTGLEAVHASRALGIPLVGTNHTVVSEFVRYLPFSGKRTVLLAEKYLIWYYNQCQTVTAPAQFILDEMSRAGLRAHTQLIPNPIDLSEFSPATDEEKASAKEQFGLSPNTLVYAGRLAQEKHIEVVLNAIALVAHTFPDLLFAIAGHGSEREALQKQVRMLGIEKHVRFLGTLTKEELAVLYKGSELFVSASTSEVHSMTLMQAFASGIPAIGVRAKGLGEYITEQNGTLVGPGNTEDFAHAITLLLSDRAKRESLGQSASQSIQTFSVKKIAKTWLDLYVSVASKKQ